MSTHRTRAPLEARSGSLSLVFFSSAKAFSATLPHDPRTIPLPLSLRVYSGTDGKNIAQGKDRTAELQEFAHQREGGLPGFPSNHQSCQYQ